MNSSLINKLQDIQNSVARAVCPRVRRCDHISPTLKQLHWLPVEKRIIFKIAVLTFNVISNKSPLYLHDLIIMPQKSTTRSSGKNLLVVPLTKSESDRRSFSYASPSVWNSLPQNLRDCHNIETFKKHLKTFLFPTEHKLF